MSHCSLIAQYLLGKGHLFGIKGLGLDPLGYHVHLLLQHLQVFLLGLNYFILLMYQVIQLCDLAQIGVEQQDIQLFLEAATKAILLCFQQPIYVLKLVYLCILFDKLDPLLLKLIIQVENNLIERLLIVLGLSVAELAHSLVLWSLERDTLEVSNLLLEHLYVFFHGLFHAVIVLEQLFGAPVNQFLVVHTH